MKKLLLGLMIILMAVPSVGADQHDYVIGNAAGSVVRADINNALQAIVTNNSGASAPATTYPNMWWYDTSTSLLKRRNNANDTWITTGLEAADTDGTLSANSDLKVATQKATKTYADTKVSLTGAQTIAGIKTFSSFPATPSTAPTTDYQVANKKYVDDNGGIVGASVQAIGTTDISGAGSEVDMADMSITLTTVGTKLLVLFSAPFYGAHSSGIVPSFYYINIDGVNKRKTRGSTAGTESSNSEIEATFQHLETGLTPGSHTVKIRWNAPNTERQYGSTYGERILTVIDLP